MENITKISSLQEGKYQIESILGTGGFGNTYLATQVALGRKVAIKEFFMKEYCDRDQTTSRVVIPTASSCQIVDRYKQKFLKEAQMIAALKNEHVVQIHDIFEENGTAYYVMEYVSGGSLKDKVEREGALTEVDAVGYIRQVAEALSYLHSNNILHLDVKPANILLNDEDSPVLIDFGISKHYDSEGGQTSTTPAGISKGFAPIEQYQQDNISSFTPSTDVYSLGATLFYLLTGQVPPEASLIYEDGLPSAINQFSPQLQRVITVAMAPRRKDRFQTTASFVETLSDTGTNKKPLSVNSPVQETEETTILLEDKVILSQPIEKDASEVTSEMAPENNKSGAGVKKLVIAAAAVILAIILFSLGGNKPKQTPPTNNSKSVTTTTVPSTSTNTTKQPVSTGTNKTATPDAKPTRTETDVKAANLKTAINQGNYTAVKELADEGYSPAYIPLAKYYLQTPSTHNLADKYAKKAKAAGIKGSQDIIDVLEGMGYYD